MALQTHSDAWNILLKDSEGPVADANPDSVFWMVEMMESWFHADKDKLEEFYGQNFNRSALKANPKVEEILKSDLETGLKEATKRTSKGNYFDNKTSHGPKLLEMIDPEKVQTAAPNCKRLFAAVLKELE